MLVACCRTKAHMLASDRKLFINNFTLPVTTAKLIMTNYRCHTLNKLWFLLKYSNASKVCLCFLLFMLAKAMINN